MTSCASKCPADLIRWQKSVGDHQNPAHTSPTHLSTHSYPTLISKKHHMLTSREKCGLTPRATSTGLSKYQRCGKYHRTRLPRPSVQAVEEQCCGFSPEHLGRLTTVSYTHLPSPRDRQ